MEEFSKAIELHVLYAKTDENGQLCAPLSFSAINTILAPPR